RKNKITGALSLWTAHTVGVNSAGVSSSADRNGARWYEITGTQSTPAAPLGGSPTLVQAGTLFDSAGSNPKGYIYPSIAGSGQGHAAFGTTFASAALNTS